MRSMFTHLENDLCRTIFVHIYLIYVKSFTTFSSNESLFIAAWEAGRGGWGATEFTYTLH